MSDNNTKHLYVVFFNEDYEITQNGRVISHRLLAYELKQRTLAGYKYISLKINNKLQNHAVHRLVAICYHGLPPTPTHLVRHLDGTKDNNHYNNLLWGTNADNREDDKRNGITQQQANKVRDSNKQRWSPERREAFKQKIVNQPGWKQRFKDNNQKQKQYWQNATPEQLQKRSQTASETAKKNWANKTPQERSKIAQARADKARQQQIQRVNEGRSRPYLDATGPNGPQIDLFDTLEDQNTTER